MSTYKYKDGNKQLIANHMEDVENASFRETMIKFHASSMVPVLKAYLENDKNCPFPYDDEIIDVVALMMATQTYETCSSEKFDPCFGETTLTEGQMRTIINQADVLIVRIFDNGSHWHCFLQTYKGLKGMESGVQGSRPHLHYLSDSFGISKADLVKMIKIGRYPNTPVHIPLLSDKSED